MPGARVVWAVIFLVLCVIDVVVARGLSEPQEAAVAVEDGPVVELHLLGTSVWERPLDLSEVSPPPGVQVLDDNLVAWV